MIQTQLVIAVLANPEVVNSIGTRFYPNRIPQGASNPSAVYQIITTNPVSSLDGDSGLDSVKVQIKCYADSYATAVETAHKIRTAINSSSLKSITDLIMDTQDEKTKSYGVIQQFSIWDTLTVGGVYSVSEFKHIPYVGDGVKTEIELPSEIAENGFYLVTKNGFICKEDSTFTLSEDRKTIIFAEVLEGGSFADEGLIVYQERFTPDFVDESLALSIPEFGQVAFVGDGTFDYVDLPEAIADNGFYLITLNGRIAKEGAGNTYTINSARNKITFNEVLNGGDYPDEGLIIYQKT